MIECRCSPKQVGDKLIRVFGTSSAYILKVKRPPLMRSLELVFCFGERNAALAPSRGGRFAFGCRGEAAIAGGSEYQRQLVRCSNYGLDRDDGFGSQKAHSRLAHKLS